MSYGVKFLSCWRSSSFTFFYFMRAAFLLMKERKVENGKGKWAAKEK
jgi:hypothetical protein